MRKSLKAEAQGFTLLVFCWIQNQQQWQNRGTIDYHIGYRLNLENWSERSFHQTFCGQRLELSMCSECVFAEFNLIQMEVSRVMEVTPNHSLRMGQWKPPDLKHQNSETGGLFLGLVSNGTTVAQATRNLRFATEMKKKHRRYGFSPWQIISISRVGNILLIYA